jgi:hypothetical protein
MRGLGEDWGALSMSSAKASVSGSAKMSAFTALIAIRLRVMPGKVCGAPSVFSAYVSAFTALIAIRLMGACCGFALVVDVTYAKLGWPVRDELWPRSVIWAWPPAAVSSALLFGAGVGMNVSGAGGRRVNASTAKSSDIAAAGLAGLIVLISKYSRPCGSEYSGRCLDRIFNGDTPCFFCILNPPWFKKPYCLILQSYSKYYEKSNKRNKNEIITELYPALAFDGKKKDVCAMNVQQKALRDKLTLRQSKTAAK